MNWILTKTKQGNFNMFWEPFATSTPLKQVTDKVKIVNGSQKQPIIDIDSFNVVGKLQNHDSLNALQKKSAESKLLTSRRPRKNKSSVYFDLSSSSDEESLEGSKKRPIIKCSSGKKTRSLLNIENVDDQENKIRHDFNTKKTFDNSNNVKNINIEGAEKNINPDIKDFQLQTSEVLSNNENIRSNSVKLNSNLNKVSQSSNEKDLIFEEIVTCKDLEKFNSFLPENKENTSNHSKNNCKKKNLAEIPKTNQMPLRSIQKTFGEEFQDVKSSCKSVPESSNPFKISKRKNIVKTALPNNKCGTRRTRTKCLLQSESAATPIRILELKKNHSHQLFSDSKEKETIDTLNLTCDEINEPLEISGCFLWKKERSLPHESITSLSPNKKALVSNINVKERPKRKKQKPKKFWMLENSSEAPLTNIENAKKIKIKKNSCASLIKPNNCNQEFAAVRKPEETEIKEKIIQKKNNVNQRVEKKKRKTESLGEAKKNTAKKSVEENALKNDVISCSELNKHLSNINVEPNKSSTGLEEEKAETAEEPVFKQLNELKYNENETGCSVSQCWNIGHLKCGVFKVNVKSQLTWKTHSNSYLGGVLVEGDLKMKIGLRELNLSKGDMALVPPSTEWNATNIGKKESIFYYWCGKFNN